MHTSRHPIVMVIAVGVWALTCSAGRPARAADLTLRELVTALWNSDASRPLNFSGKDLSFLDLSDLDFKRANLAGANLLGANLTGANLAFVNLSGAKLDRTSLARANFTGANLTNATMYDVVGSLNFQVPASEAPIFTNANLSGARIFARLSRSNLHGVTLTDADLGTERNQFKMPKQTDLSGAILTEANLLRANFTGANLMFAKMMRANLEGAILIEADLSRADLSGADLTGADVTKANLDGAIFKNAKGLESLRGLDAAMNRDKALF